MPVLVWLAYSALRATWRIRVQESDDLKSARAAGRTQVFAHWHGDELALISIIPRYRAAVMTSTSEDGQLITSVLRLMGVEASRGSSTRGGASALKGLLRLTRTGFNPSVAVDGPKGPLHEAKAGVFEISRVVGGAIFPAGCRSSRSVTFPKSWNQTYLPLPFARIEIVFGPCLPAVARTADPRDPSLAKRLGDALADAGHQAASNLIATPKGRCYLF